MRLACAPMGAAGRAIGVILADRSSTRRRSTRAERQLLWTLGKAAALASVARTVATQAENAKQLQQRIDLAREVHEGVIQRLFGVSMALDGDGDLPGRRAVSLRERDAGRPVGAAQRAAAPARAGAAGDRDDAVRRGAAAVAGPSRARDRARGRRDGEVPPSLEAARSERADRGRAQRAQARRADRGARPDESRRRGASCSRSSTTASRPARGARDGAAPGRVRGAAEWRGARVRQPRARVLAGAAGGSAR